MGVKSKQYIVDPLSWLDTEELAVHKNLQDLIMKSLDKVEDGFDLAYVDGLHHILKESGDGGISENYFRGLQKGIEILKNR